MSTNPIISRGEALTILKNDLRELTLKRHSQDLENATEPRRQEILAEIERDVIARIRQRQWSFRWQRRFGMERQ